MSISDGSKKLKTVEAAKKLRPHDGATSHIQRIRQMAELDLLTTKSLEEKKIIGASSSNKSFINTFREIRTKLIQRSNKQNFLVMVTSVVDGGGASFMATNLAAAFALDQSKTGLLVDCNLFDPELDKLFELSPDYGLTDYLEDPTLDIEDIIYATGIRRLRVIPAGSFREAGAEYFSSERMGQLMKDIVARYPDRFVFLDAPPAAVSAEGRILADLCDYSIIVVPYGKVTLQQIQASIDAVGKDKVAGIIFNN